MITSGASTQADARRKPMRVALYRLPDLGAKLRALGATHFFDMKDLD